MKSVEVRAGQQRYEVLIGPGLLAEIGALVRGHFRGERCAVISDANVVPLFAGKICDSLRQAGFRPELIEVAPGENSKSIRQAASICEKLNTVGLDRSSFLVSLGGGMVSDLAGFVASIYLRGIPYVSVPTTLLAQIDSCIGGKTGVNANAGKNLIGSFHHPSLVVADTETLRTLPDPIWNEGFAEAIKHGIICDRELFESIPGVDRQDPTAFVERNLAIKAAIVATDAHEQNDIRALLNFGHTIGHAIEHAAGYDNLLHGEAISLGIVAAARVSIQRAGLSLGECEQIIATLRACHLPTTLPPDFPREKFFAALPRDKKFENGCVRFVVADEIGRARVSTEVTMDDLRAAVDAL